MAYKIYFVNLNNLERLEAQFIPDVLNTTSRGDWQDVKVVSRNTPIPHFSGGAEDIRFELDFYSDKEDRSDVVEKVKWLRSLRYADEGGRVPRVKLVWGELYRDEVWVMKSVDSRFELFDKVGGMRPVQAYVSITMSLDPVNNLTANDYLK